MIVFKEHFSFILIQFYASWCTFRKLWLFAFKPSIGHFAMMTQHYDPSDFNTGLNICKMWTWNSIFLLATNHLQVWQITMTLKCTMSWKSSVSEVAWFSTACVLFYINATQYLESHNMWGLRIVEFRIVKLLVCIKNVTVICVTKVPKIGP